MERKNVKAVTKVNPVTGKTEVHWVKLNFRPNTYESQGRRSDGRDYGSVSHWACR